MGSGVGLMQLRGTWDGAVECRSTWRPGLACRRTNLTIRLKLLEQGPKVDCFWFCWGGVSAVISASDLDAPTFHGSADVAYWCSCSALRAEAEESGSVLIDVMAVIPITGQG